MPNRRTFFATAASGLAWLLGVKALPGIAYASYLTARANGCAYVVTCDGKPLKWVKEANATEGWAICYSENEKGQKHAKPNIFGSWIAVTHKVRGHIVIKEGERMERIV